MTKKATGKKKEALALLPQPVADSVGYEPRMHVDFPLEQIKDCKIGQEVVVTIRGHIAMLEGKHYGMEKGCIGIHVMEKSLKKTSSPQTEGLRALTEDGEDY